MDCRIQVLLCIILCEVLCNQYVDAEVTCPDFRDISDVRPRQYWEQGYGDRNYYDGYWPTGDYTLFMIGCFHIRNATHRFSAVPHLRDVYCLESGKWWIGWREERDGYLGLGYCAHCPDIIEPHGEVINYTSQLPLPNPKIRQNWRINKQIHPPEKWPVRTTAFIRCHDGYLPSGINKRTCNFDGSWSKTDCKQIVCEALSLPHGLISYNKSSVEGGYPIDTEVSFSCQYGYHRSGPSSRICQPSGTWSLQTPTCQKVRCPALNLPNGLINYNKLSVSGGFPVDTEAFFSCNCGYSQSGPSSRICQLSGTWSLPTTTCNQISCEALSLTNGQISYDRSPINGRYTAETVASFSCNDEYSQFGPSSRNCRTSGAWNSQTTTCEISCKALEKIGFGHVTYAKSPSIVDGTYPHNTIANFSCADGFSKSGPEVRTCQASGKWDKGNQSCRIAKP